MWCGRAGAALVAVLLAGCTGDGSTARSRSSTPASPAAEAGVADTARPEPIGGTAAALASASIREVVGSRTLVGQRVRVTGRCLRPGTEHALDRPPRSSHEWQLEAEGVAVFVIGPQPRGCRRGDAQPLTITALVAEDTLPAIGDLPPAPRRFLVFAGEESR